MCGDKQRMLFAHQTYQQRRTRMQIRIVEMRAQQVIFPVRNGRKKRVELEMMKKEKKTTNQHYACERCILVACYSLLLIIMRESIYGRSTNKMVVCVVHVQFTSWLSIAISIFITHTFCMFRTHKHTLIRQNNAIQFFLFFLLRFSFLSCCMHGQDVALILLHVITTLNLSASRALSLSLARLSGSTRVPSRAPSLLLVFFCLWVLLIATCNGMACT